MKDLRDVILAPVVSEKSYDLIENNNTYTFMVDPRSNKSEIKMAVEQVFGVRVLRVNTMNRRQDEASGLEDGQTQRHQACRGHARPRQLDRPLRGLSMSKYQVPSTEYPTERSEVV